MPVATVDELGEFDASTKLPGDGALPGNYRVSVIWRTDPDDDQSPNRLPERYMDPITSGISVTAGPDSTDLPVILLTDK